MLAAFLSRKYGYSHCIFMHLAIWYVDGFAHPFYYCLGFTGYPLCKSLGFLFVGLGFCSFLGFFFWWRVGLGWFGLVFLSSSVMLHLNQTDSDFFLLFKWKLPSVSLQTHFIRVGEIKIKTSRLI